MKPTKILWTCRECGAQAVTEKRPDTVTIERCNIPRGWVHWLGQTHCPNEWTTQALARAFA